MTKEWVFAKKKKVANFFILLILVNVLFNVGKYGDIN